MSCHQLSSSAPGGSQRTGKRNYLQPKAGDHTGEWKYSIEFILVTFVGNDNSSRGLVILILIYCRGMGLKDGDSPKKK